MERRFEYKTSGVCSSKIIIEIDEEDVIKKVEFVGGCAGNTKGVSKLCVGRKADEVIELLEGIPCGFRGTSCPDQLAKALVALTSSELVGNNL